MYILQTYARWWWVKTFMHRSLYPQRKSPWHPFGLGSFLDVVEKYTNLSDIKFSPPVLTHSLIHGTIPSIITIIIIFITTIIIQLSMKSRTNSRYMYSWHMLSLKYMDITNTTVIKNSNIISPFIDYAKKQSKSFKVFKIQTKLHNSGR